MRNLFLSLVLANVLLLAWQFWVEPVSPPPRTSDRPGLALFESGKPPVPRSDPSASAPGFGAAATALPTGACFRLGPLADVIAAQQAARSLATRDIRATPIARDAQQWLGHWVQIAGFDSAAAAEKARGRLVAGGLADALLMQDGAQPLISLGVFRERDRADRVANAARQLGFEVGMRDRYRPAVEQWLLIQPQAGQVLAPADLRLAGDRIMRAEPASCDPAGSAAATGDPIRDPGPGPGPARSAVSTPVPGIPEEPL